MFYRYKKRNFIKNNKFYNTKKYIDYKKNTKLTKKQKRNRAESRKYFFNLRKQKENKIKSTFKKYIL